MSEKFKVSFNSPQCGWMSIGFSSGENEFLTTTAHAPHSRALSELLEILTELLRDNTSKTEFLLKWNRNPEEFDFKFCKENNNSVNFQIFQFPTEKRQSSEKVFEVTCEIIEFAEAFHTTYLHLKEDIDTDAFIQNWHQPFPFSEFSAFESAFKK
jgi:hypothetical protein